MMPGESQSKTVPIAADATVGTCQNCSVLHQSLTDYVASFLALKQKITDSEEAIRLQQQLEELQMRLLSLEKKNADYELVQAELEEKKCVIRGFEKMSEEMEELKEEYSKTVAQNKMLEDNLKDVKEVTETQTLKNVHLKMEKAAVENELLKTQASLKASQAQADRVDELIEENTKTTSIKNSLENQVKQLEESVCKQNHEMAQMTRQKTLLERSMHDVQVRLMAMERERNKEYKSASTQASVPEPPKVDKEKVRMLLENLWACVEQQQQPTNKLHLHESSTKQVHSSPENRLHSNLGELDTFQSPTHRVHEAQRHSIPSKTTCNYVEKVIKHQETLKNTNGKRQTRKAKEQKVKCVSPDLDSRGLNIEEIFDLFKPMPPCISPLPRWDKGFNSLKTKDGEMGNHSKPGDDCVQQEESLLGTTSASSHSPECSVLLTEEPVDLPMDTTEEMEHVWRENNIAQNDASDNNTDKRHSTKIQEDMQTDLLPGAGQLSSSSPLSSASIVLDEIPLLSTENNEPVFSVNPSCSRTGSIPEAHCNTQNPQQVSVELFGEEADDQFECTTKTNVVANAGEDTGTEVIPPRDGDSLERSESPPVSLAASDVQSEPSSIPTCSLQSSEVPNTNNGREIEETYQDSSSLGLDHQNVAVSEDNSGSQSEDDARLSHIAESGISNVPSDKPQARSENDVSSKQLGETIADEPQTGTSEVSASSPKTNGATTPGIASPLKSPPLIIADVDDPLADQESGNKSNETSSTNDVSTGTLNSQIVAEGSNGTSHFDTEQTVDIEPMQKRTHLLCKQLVSSCQLATVKQRSSKPQTHTERGNANVNGKCPSVNTDLQPVSNLVEKDVIEKATVKDLPQERIVSSEKEVNKSRVTPTDAYTTSLGQSGAATNGQNDSEKLCMVVPKKLSVGITREAETTAQPLDSMRDVQSEMGPPLPSLLTPLSLTPTKKVKPINPTHAIEKLTFPSPLDSLASPTTPVKMTSNAQQLTSTSLHSPVPSNGVPSSPLQFGSATPKHAVPVPGRLPFAAMNSSPSSSNPSQENSMRILDTMYPELSARARTLSILRGNVGLSICSSENGTPPTADSQMSGFKTINSAATAFTKTELRGEKRPAVRLPQPKNNKFPKLETSFVISKPALSSSTSSVDDDASPQALKLKDHTNEVTSQSTEGGKPAKQTGIVNALEKIEKQCFDLLPVIKSHLYVGNLPKKPVLRDEEKEVISECCQNSLFTADDMSSAILKKLTTEKSLISENHMQALCRVYTGICRQSRDWEKAHILAYSILTEDFLDPAKLILFIVATWPAVLSHSSSLCQAIHTVTRLKASEEVLSCLSAYLGWEKTPPLDSDQLISRTLSEIESGSSLSFTTHSHYGYDLDTETWKHIFTLYLLCTNTKWLWTYEHLLGKVLWPLMNTWVQQPRTQQAPISDATVATVIRLIGRLGCIGIKERNVSSVVTIASIINMFGRHGQAEGVPWEIQLAAVYCIYDLSPCNPRKALDALAGWRAETTQSIPPAVTSCINQLSFMCRQEKR
ncbi:little elongation complex subunit 1 [Genypterus blacodes]|uniref:little elongation complex subunit 1 n=1 Tax=Genypterus blacodes TaxID=154954 RepID=UPI003F773391